MPDAKMLQLNEAIIEARAAQEEEYGCSIITVLKRLHYYLCY